jgi:hypothetical protein
LAGLAFIWRAFEHAEAQAMPNLGGLVWVSRPIPDKTMSQPSLGLGTVGFSSILHDDLKSRAAAAG